MSSTNDRREAGESAAVDWAVEEGVRCVVCPTCAFTFDAIHTDNDGRYSCPQCDYLDLEMDNRRLLGAVKEARQMVADWAAYASDYFTEKWDLAGDLRRLDEAIDASGAEHG